MALEEIPSCNQQILQAFPRRSAANDLGGNNLPRKIQVSTKPVERKSPTQELWPHRLQRAVLAAVRIPLLH